MEEDLSPPAHFAVLAASFEASLTLVAICLGWLMSKPPLETLQTSAYSLGEGFLAVAPMLVLLWLCVRLPFRPFSDVTDVADRQLTPLFRNCNLVEMAAISLLAGLGEEMLFRGVLQGALGDWTGGLLGGSAAANQAAHWTAAAVVAVLFGLMHAVNASYTLLAAVIGFYLGGLWILTGNLIVPITAHTVYDFLALVYLVRIRKPTSQ